MPDFEMTEANGREEGGMDLRIRGWAAEKPWYAKREITIPMAAAFVLSVGLALFCQSKNPERWDLSTYLKINCEDESDPMADVAKNANYRSPNPLPKPSTFCEGGTDGVLRRLSRDAFSYWESVLPPADKSIIVMLADGYGPSIHTMTRDVSRILAKSPNARLALDDYLVGSSFTGATGDPITDSAAGATAYSAGRKTFNGALAVEPTSPEFDSQCAATFGGTNTAKCPPGTAKEGCCPVKRIAHLMEGCKAKGMATGIVVTTVMPHATPAAWSSHSSSRSYYDFIAQQQIEAQPPFDVLLGGGLRYFDGRRADKKDKLAEFADVYTVVKTARGLQDEVEASGRAQKPMVGLFADKDMAYEVDRIAQPAEKRQPSLKEMTRAALTRLKATGKHYCLLVEGSRVDHALHSSDPASAARDAVAYDEAFKEALKEVADTRGNTQVLSVADHSTGGLTTGMQPDWELTYSGANAQWAHGPKPYRAEVLARANMSTGLAASHLCCDVRFAGEGAAAAREDFVSEMLGLVPGGDQLKLLGEARGRMPPGECTPSQSAADWPSGACGMGSQLVLNRMVHLAAGVGMTTSSHTSEDIHVYAAGSLRRRFAASDENSRIGQVHIGLLGISLDPITQALNDCDVPVHPSPVV